MIEKITKYFPDLSKVQNDQFYKLGYLYPEWNDKINVISRKDIDNLYIHHILHSLAIARMISFKSGTNVLDVGTGGGFPGIPLAIMFPDVHFTLVDSIAKKIKVVNQIANEAAIKNVTAVHTRAEKVNGKYDFVVSRAVTRLSKFISWTRKKTDKKNINDMPNGILYLKGGDITEELEEIQTTYYLKNLSDFFEEEFFETKVLIHIPL